MGSVNLVIIVESARAIITHGNGETNKFDIAALAAVAAALGQSISTLALSFIHDDCGGQSLSLSFSCTVSLSANIPVKSK
jgi:hypothetical protein